MSGFYIIALTPSRSRWASLGFGVSALGFRIERTLPASEHFKSFPNPEDPQPLQALNLNPNLQCPKL